MRDNPVQFAVVREDPLVEAALVEESGAAHVMLIGSGGCTALNLQALFPRLRITLVDPNPAQLDLIQRKMSSLREASGEARRLFNVGTGDPSGLNACGNFESLFRGFSNFVGEFILGPEELRRMFDSVENLRAARGLLFGSRYWPVAFDLFFSDSLLNAMFGPDATQHAPAGSYPAYFRKVFERGLASEAAADNYFLHHIFLGYYLDGPQRLPLYLTRAVPKYNFHMIQATATEVGEMEDFDVVSLSNIFDWMPEASVADLAQTVAGGMRRGARLVFRQLNNAKDFRALFAEHFDFDGRLGAELLARDRSLFYSGLSVATRR